MMTLTIDDRTARALRERADAHGVPVEELIRRAADEPDPRVTPRPQLSIDEFKRVLKELSADSSHLSPLPADFSREDIYFDHD